MTTSSFTFPVTAAEEATFDKKTLGAAVQDIWRIVNVEYLTAASNMREIKLKLVARIVVAHEVALANSLVTVVIESARKQNGYPAKGARVKHGDFGLFARACLGGEMEKSLRKNSPVVTQLVDDAYAVWKTYGKRMELVLGNESAVADTIRTNTYKFFQDALEALEAGSPTPAGTPKGPARLNTTLSDIVRNEALSGKGTIEVMSAFTEKQSDVFVVSPGGIVRLIKGEDGVLAVAKAVSYKGELFARLSGLLEAVN